MALVEVPLNSYKYHFRSLTWEEEMRLSFPEGENSCRVLLAAALHDVSGLVVTHVDAKRVIAQFPTRL